MNFKSTIKNIVMKNATLRYMTKSVRNIFLPTNPTNDIRKNIAIEVSSVCNAKCIFCNYRLGLRTKHMMPLGEFKGIAKSCVDLGFENLDLTSLGGELFTHPDAIEIIRAAKTAGFKHIGVFSNAIAIHRYDVKNLLLSGIDAILISFPGFDRNVYERVFKVKAYDDFIKSITVLLETHKIIGSKVYIVFEPRTYLTAKQIKQSDFYKQVLSRQLSEHVVLRDPLRVFDNWGGSIKKTDLIEGMKLDDNPLKSIWPLKKTYLCNRILSIGIFANGDVRLCNCRYNETIETKHDSLTIGNIHNYDGLPQLLETNKKKIDDILADFQQGKMPELCRKCPFYIPVSPSNYKGY